MKPLTIGLVDYGMGNHASVFNALHDLNFRVRISSSIDVLSETDGLLLPGVGAFPKAMESLHDRGLVKFLCEWANHKRPIIGICLGMQLLTNSSLEHIFTAGLGLIPGDVIPLSKTKFHIGWNNLECSTQDRIFASSDGCSFYFNHSFCYQGPEEYQVAITRSPEKLVAAIRRENVIGMQFHPEKSQSTGRTLLSNVILGLCGD